MTAAESWSVDCLEAGGALDERAKGEATQKAPDSLLSLRYDACRREHLELPRDTLEKAGI